MRTERGGSILSLRIERFNSFFFKGVQTFLFRFFCSQTLFGLFHGGVGFICLLWFYIVFIKIIILVIIKKAF